MEVSLQRKNWEELQKHIDTVLASLTSSTIIETFKKLFQVNIIRATGILALAILKKQTINNDSLTLAGLTALLDQNVADLGYLVSRECLLNLVYAYRNNDQKTLYSMGSLACQLCNQDVLHEVSIFQVLFLLLESCTCKSVRLACFLMSQCGYHLLMVSKRTHNRIVDILRNLLQEGMLSHQCNTIIQEFLGLRRLEYKGISRGIDLGDLNVHTHKIILDLDNKNLSPDATINQFRFDKDFFNLEEEFNKLRGNVMSGYSKQEEIIETVSDMTNTDDVQFKKELYLILKNSLTGDEAAHKLLKLRVKKENKSIVANIIVQTCSQEQTYSKYYGLTAEKLCANHKTWGIAFKHTFKNIYTSINDMDSKQIRNIGKLWGHLLATDYLGFEAFECVHLNEKETTASSRIYLKFIFNELVQDLGINELQKRLDEEYIQPYLKYLFPMNNFEDTLFAINYFTAIGLGALTEKMRQTLDTSQHENPKRKGDASPQPPPRKSTA